MSVASIPTSREFVRADRTRSLCHATPNHFVVKSSIGHFWPMLSLKA